MKPVSPDAEPRIKLRRNGIMKRVGRKRLMEGRIKNRDLWLIGKQLRCHANALRTRWIVQRSEVAQLFDALDYFLIDNGRVPKILAPVNNTMAQCSDLVWQGSPEVIDYAT